MPDLSILTPARVDTPQARDWLVECIDSVNRTALDVEHVIADDASTVDLADVRRAHPEVRWLRFDERQGAAKARNAAALTASAEWLFSLDADDLLIEGGIEQLYRWRCREGFVYAPLHTFSDPARMGKMGYDARYNRDKLRSLEGPIGINGLFHRDVWRLLHGWTPGIEGREDLEFWIKMAELGMCGVMVDVPVVAWRQHPDGLTAGLNADRARLREVADEIRRRHRVFFTGGKDMPCRKCPQPNTVIEVSVSDPVESPDGKVALKYAGARQGSFYTPNAPSGARYRINGRGTWLFVDPRDVEFFTRMRTAGKPDYQPQIVEHFVNVDEPATQEDIEWPELPPPVYMGALNAKDALKAIREEPDMTVLRVWRAQEMAREQPRKTILEEIAARMGAA